MVMRLLEAPTGNRGDHRAGDDDDEDITITIHKFIDVYNWKLMF